MKISKKLFRFFVLFISIFSFNTGKSAIFDNKTTPDKVAKCVSELEKMKQDDAVKDKFLESFFKYQNQEDHDPFHSGPAF